MVNLGHEAQIKTWSCLLPLLSVTLWLLSNLVSLKNINKVVCFRRKCCSWGSDYIVYFREEFFFFFISSEMLIDKLKTFKSPQTVMIIFLIGFRGICLTQVTLFEACLKKTAKFFLLWLLSSRHILLYTLWWSFGTCAVSSFSQSVAFSEPLLNGMMSKYFFFLMPS